MGKLRNLNTIFNKNSLKALMMGAALVTTGCVQPTTSNIIDPGTGIENPEIPNHNYKLETIGGARSVYKGYVAKDNNDGDVAMYGDYVKGLAKGINDDIDDERTKNYWKPYLDVVMNNDYNEDNIKQVTKSNYNSCSYILEDLIKTLPTERAGIQLGYSLITVANKGYEQGKYMSGKTRIGYNEKMNNMIGFLQYCGMTKTDNLQENYDKYLTDMADNNCTLIAQGLDDILFTAIVNLNQREGLKLKTTHMQSLANILAATRAEMGKVDFQANTYDVIKNQMEDNIQTAIVYVCQKNQVSTMEN